MIQSENFYDKFKIMKYTSTQLYSRGNFPGTCFAADTFKQSSFKLKTVNIKFQEAATFHVSFYSVSNTLL